MSHWVPIKAGFHYVQAVLELRRVMSYEQIAVRCGFGSASGISAILSGTVPSHPRGEALYILYCETFGKKPE